MAAPQGSFAPAITNVQGLESLTTSGPERRDRQRWNRDLEAEKWVGSMDETHHGTRLHRPASRLSRRSTSQSGEPLIPADEDRNINADWALSEEVSEYEILLREFPDRAHTAHGISGPRISQASPRFWPS